MKNKIIALNLSSLLNKLPVVIDENLFLSDVWALISLVRQPFQPTVIRNGESLMLNDTIESLSAHTQKDMVGVTALMTGDIEALVQVLPDIELFDQNLKQAVSYFVKQLGLESIQDNFLKLTELYYIFIFYHDIGKTNESRQDHEAKGASQFDKLKVMLPETDKQIINWFIRFHGVYADVDRARNNSKEQNNEGYYYLFNKMKKKLLALSIKNEDKVVMLKLMATFNFIEGLQSDRFSWTMVVPGSSFHEGYKYRDILYYYQLMIDEFADK